MKAEKGKGGKRVSLEEMERKGGQNLKNTLMIDMIKARRVRGVIMVITKTILAAGMGGMVEMAKAKKLKTDMTMRTYIEMRTMRVMMMIGFTTEKKTMMKEMRMKARMERR